SKPSSQIRCPGTSTEGFDIPVIWQGSASEYSIFVRTPNGPAREINYSGNLYGKWGIYNFLPNDGIGAIAVLHSKPIPGMRD
ncbi:MAG: hypothetical protein LUH04_05320, partial [Clostridium sp.]|nr:hypothetical protein [Clostridium sp.]